MKKMLTRLAFTAMLALSLLASTSSALASDAKNGRETAWTDLELGELPGGVTWELEPVGASWDE